MKSKVYFPSRFFRIAPLAFGMCWSNVLLALAILLVSKARADEEQSVLDRVLDEQGIEYRLEPGAWDSDFLWVQMEYYLGEVQKGNGRGTLDKGEKVAQVVLQSWDRVNRKRKFLVKDIMTCRNFPAGSVRGVPTPVVFKRTNRSLDLRFSQDQRWNVVAKLVWLQREILALEAQIQQEEFVRDHKAKGSDLNATLGKVLRASYEVDKGMASFGVDVIDVWRREQGVKEGGEEILKLKALHKDTSSFQEWKATDRGRRQIEAWTAELTDKQRADD